MEKTHKQDKIQGKTSAAVVEEDALGGCSWRRRGDEVSWLINK